jgi:hypothetical protein
LEESERIRESAAELGEQRRIDDCPQRDHRASHFDAQARARSSASVVRRFRSIGKAENS